MAKTASHQPKAHKTELEREKAIALYSQGFSQTEIANKIGVAKSTIHGWIKKYKSENPNNEIESTRTEKKKEFVHQVWDVIGDSVTLLSTRVRTALTAEAEIDGLIKEVLADGDMTEAQKKALISKMSALQLHNIRDISTVIGTLYDKQALAEGESTQNINGLEVTIKVVD